MKLPKIPPRFTLGFTPSFHRLTHLHVICPNLAFYNTLGDDDGGQPPALESLVIEILQAAYEVTRGTPNPDALVLGALADPSSCQNILLFLSRANKLKEFIIKLQFRDSAYPGLSTCLAQLKTDTRVKVIYLPVNEQVQRLKLKGEDVHQYWVDRACKAADEVVEYWMKN